MAIIALEKTYLYKVYKNNVFLGVLQNVSSDFGYSQDINSNAVQIAVDVDVTADVATDATTAILDEGGKAILDEAGAEILEERGLDVVGSFNPSALIQENNEVKVYEVSDDNVNGKLVFDGWIQSWEASLGAMDDKVSFVAISNGVDLADYVITTGQSTAASNTGDDTEIQYAFWCFAVAQNIVPASPLTFSQMTLKFRNTSTSQPVNVQAYLCQGDPSLDTDSVIGGAATYSFGGTNAIIDTFAPATIPINQSTAAEKTFSLPAARTLSTGVNYYILFFFDVGNSSELYVRATTLLASSPLGRAYVARGIANNASFGMSLDATNKALYIKLLATTGSTNTAYSSTDPALIAESILDNYAAQGGVVTYSAASVDLSSVLATYTFKVNTALEGIKKCLELAPSNYYWYVDPATQLLYFKQTATAATHKFIKGRHFEQIKIGGTVEQVRNIVYFSGGDDGSGSNLFKLYTNSTSVTAQGRRRLERLSDNRVTVTSTADLIANNFLTQNAAIVYSTPVTISGSTYDISTINVGDVIGLEGFGNFADSLLLQVARLVRRPDSIDLTLGVLLQRSSDILTQALNDLDKLQTVDNPSAPS